MEIQEEFKSRILNMDLEELRYIMTQLVTFMVIETIRQGSRPDQKTEDLIDKTENLIFGKVARKRKWLI